MSEDAEMYRRMDEEKKARHRQWKEQNTKILNESGIAYRAASEECYIFRNGKAKADFYPSTGRWRVPGLSNTFRGGARAFIEWYKKQMGGEQ